MALKSSGEIPIKYFRKTLAKLGVFLHNYATGESFPNHFWQSCGYNDEDMSQQRWLEYLHPDDVERVKKAMEDITAGKTDLFDEIYRIKVKGGEYRWVYSSGDFISREDDGSPALYMGSDRDITSLKNAEAQLSGALEISRKKTLQTQTLLSVAKSVMADLDLQKSVETILEKTEDIIPYDFASVLLVKDNVLTVAGVRGDNREYELPLIELDSENMSPYSMIINSKEGAVVSDFTVFDSSSLPEHFSTVSSWLGIPLVQNNRVLGLLCCYLKKSDFDEEDLQLAEGIAGFMAIALANAANHEEITKLAVSDPLTGLKTRRWFYENAERLIDQSRRYNWSVAVLMMDLDHFKSVNDNFGHKTGDRVLINTAEVLTAISRRSDLLCRYGGEEFALILPETDLEDAGQMAERIRRGIEDLNVEGIDRKQTISIGISISRPGCTSSIDELLDLADQALYQAKDEGRNRWVSLEF
ncbi:MAG: diguanylate cyclase [Spirochaetales bacterium]|nr:diguanylate cyclase [Spirochaetales bacterium]